MYLRVSYTGITSAFQADERGSTPLTRSILRLSGYGMASQQNKRVSLSRPVNFLKENFYGVTRSKFLVF